MRVSIASQHRRHLILVLTACLAIAGCDNGNDALDGGTPPTADSDVTPANDGSTPSTEDGSTPNVPNSCDAYWADVATAFPDASSLGSCDGNVAGERIVDSLFDLSSISIDNNGTTMYPCIEARCDADYIYIVSNTLPHYDYVATTPNELVESEFIYRIPLNPTVVNTTTNIDTYESLNGCVDAYNQYIANQAEATNGEPSETCFERPRGSPMTPNAFISFGGTVSQKIDCFGTFGPVLNGTPMMGPNEAAAPDPYGTPVFSYPLVAGGDYGNGASLDLCGAHTAAAPLSLHNHGVNAACFERAADGTPANSYATAASTWSMEEGLNGNCTEESGIVGWSLDGFPMRGPCVCVARAADGSCSDIRRARSSWAYRGLGDWNSRSGANPDTAGALSVEGTSCTADTDCCADPSARNCNFRCTYAVFDNASSTGGSEVAQRCVLYDYSWCTHQYVDRSSTNTDSTSFVYLDACNGYEGPDGYAYHATLSFPYLQGCYHGVPGEFSNGR